MTSKPKSHGIERTEVALQLALWISDGREQLLPLPPSSTGQPGPPPEQEQMSSISSKRALAGGKAAIRDVFPEIVL